MAYGRPGMKHVGTMTPMPEPRRWIFLAPVQLPTGMDRATYIAALAEAMAAAFKRAAEESD